VTDQAARQTEQTLDANDERAMARPLHLAAALLLIVGLFRAAHDLALDQQLLFAETTLVVGSVLLTFAVSGIKL
jgi:hypothetical protein